MAKTISKFEKPAPKPIAPAPLGHLPEWERELDSWFGDLRKRVGQMAQWPFQLRIEALDVYEKDGVIVVKAEMPGMTKEGIDVSLVGSRLTITAEKKREEEVKNKDFHRQERAFGSVTRVVDLPCDVVAEQGKATFKDGVLEVRIPKADINKSKSTKVKVA